jgi:hypothetical protein
MKKGVNDKHKYKYDFKNSEIRPLKVVCVNIEYEVIEE